MVPWKTGPRKDDPRVKKIPGKMVTRKKVLGKMVSGKIVFYKFYSTHKNVSIIFAWKYRQI